MKTLNIAVSNRIATYQKRDGDIVCGNSDYEINFVFDSEWNKYTEKTARFISNNQYIDVDFKGTICPVPIIRNATQINVGVYAGDLNTTTPAVIGCKTSILCNSAAPSTENDKNYVNEAKEAADRAEEAAELAATYVPVDGKDGLSPTVSASKTGKVTTLTIKDANGTRTVTINDGLDGTPGADGKDGKDGVDGANGTNQAVPLFANDVSECTDTSKVYVLPDGYTYAYMTKKVVIEAENKFVPSTAVLNARLSGSSASVTPNGSIGCFVTDFIAISDLANISPFNVRLNFELASHEDNKVVYFNSSKSRLASAVITSAASAINPSVSNGETVFDLRKAPTAPTWTNVAYVRFQLFINNTNTALTSGDVANRKITFDHEGGVQTTTGWQNTGHAFVPADYEGRIIDLEEQAVENASKVAELENAVGNVDAVTVPTYWQDTLEEAITKVKALQDSLGSNAVNFVWFSDMHHSKGNSYTKNIGTLCAAVMDACDIPLTVMSGDTMSAESVSSETTLLEWLEDANVVLSPIGNDRLLQIRGNHDDVYGSNGTTYYVNKVAPAKIWNKIHRKQSLDFRRVFGGDGTYFYVDNIPQKVRFICLNSQFYDGKAITSGTTGAMTSGFGTAQLDWLENVALSVEDGYSVVVVTHIPPTASDINGNTYYLSQLSDGTAFRSIIFASRANILGIFCGHCHVDAAITNDLPCPIVTITCAINTPYDGTASQRVAGTDTETAIDIVTIDKSTGKIYTTRLGCGDDSEI